MRWPCSTRPRRRRHVPRHRRRLRRRPQRAARSAASCAQPGARSVTVADQDGPPRRPQVPELYTLGQLPRLDRPLAGATSASTRSTSSSCTARRRRSTRTTRVFDALDTLVDDGAIAAYGVERGDRRRGAGRDRPAGRRHRADHPQRVPAQAARARCCRPRARPGSASSRGCRSPRGLLSGRYDADTTFAADDHRTYNRHGEAFDVGETSPACPSTPASQAAQRVRAPSRPEGATPAAGRAALDHRAAGRHRRHPRRAQRRAGAGQRRRGRAAAADATSSSRASARRLRRAHPRARARPLVGLQSRPVLRAEFGQGVSARVALDRPRVARSFRRRRAGSALTARPPDPRRDLHPGPHPAGAGVNPNP